MTLKAQLNALIAPPARGKTRLVAVSADGARHVIIRKDGVWWWAPGKGSHPLAAAIDNVEAAGGHVVREPAP